MDRPVIHKRILVAPMDWGLGHATRCIPIIRALSKLGFTPVIAGSGASLELLKAEFPSLEHHTLPAYNINYSKKGHLLLLKLVLQIPSIVKTATREKKELERIISENKINGLISDNRFGLRSKKVKSIYVTHQIRVMSGLTTFISSWIHRLIINRFDECWIPDEKGKNSLSGALSDATKLKVKVRHVGILSRFSKINCKKDIDWLAVLSGPEPQRTFLEKRVIKSMSKLLGSKILVRGLINSKQIESWEEGIQIKNYMLSEELEQNLNRARAVIARSGYSSLMDLTKLGCRSILIPTPGQTEQEYLASRMKEMGAAHTIDQNKLNAERIESSFKGEIINKKTLFKGSLNEVLKRVFE